MMADVPNNRPLSSLLQGGLVSPRGEIVDPVVYSQNVRALDRREHLKTQITKEIIQDVVEERRK